MSKCGLLGKSLKTSHFYYILGAGFLRCGWELFGRWRYYRNPRCGGELAQAAGLPSRLREAGAEVVIENDIAWRVQAMVDFMFGKPVAIVSTAADEGLRRRIGRVLDAVWEASGGIGLLQDLALLGHVYGHADLVLRVDEEAGARALRRLSAPAPLLNPPASPRAATDDEEHLAAEMVRVEVVEPTRGIPMLSPDDYRKIDAYVVHYERELNETGRGGIAARWLGFEASRRRCRRTEVVTAHSRRVYEDGKLAWSGANEWTPGEVPVVHIQNISEPLSYEGVSEVEPLIPLQDELNTRLSDRAARVTMQSFKMYLAKGIEGLDGVAMGPGRVITTGNTEASMEAFGGDAASPSEERHILEIREAMDKASGVPPLASGVVRARIGNLSSANALRITLMGVLSKTARKRVTYGGGIARMCRLILTALDRAGVLRTREEDRGVTLEWPDPLPEDVHERMLAAKAKAELGVPRDRVLAELGYGGDRGVE